MFHVIVANLCPESTCWQCQVPDCHTAILPSSLPLNSWPLWNDKHKIEPVSETKMKRVRVRIKRGGGGGGGGREVRGEEDEEKIINL